MANQSRAKSFNTWRRTPRGLLAFGVLELIIAYILGSLAVDSGAIWYYLFGIAFLVASLCNFARLIKRFVRGRP